MAKGLRNCEAFAKNTIVAEPSRLCLVRNKFTSVTAPENLNDEQKKAAAELVRHLQGSGSKLHKIANLTSAANSYRDISVSMYGLQTRQLGCTKPIVYSFSPSEQLSANRKPFDGKLRLPDVSQMSDKVTVSGELAPTNLNLDQKHMDKISCWTQTMPSHVEMSYQNLSSINLFPPVNAAYPTFVDFEHAARLLTKYTSRKRVTYSRKMIKDRDKFQINTWQPHPGEA